MEPLDRPDHLLDVRLERPPHRRIDRARLRGETAPKRVGERLLAQVFAIDGVLAAYLSRLCAWCDEIADRLAEVRDRLQGDGVEPAKPRAPKIPR